MGDVVKSDYAVTSEIIKELLEQLNLEWEASTGDRERRQIADMGFVLATGFLCGLRGKEIMKIDLGGLIKYLEPGRNHMACPHLIVALLGRLKGETGERYHMMVMSRGPGAVSLEEFGQIEWLRSIGGTITPRVIFHKRTS
jgi:hypothetical protein